MLGAGRDIYFGRHDLDDAARFRPPIFTTFTPYIACAGIFVIVSADEQPPRRAYGRPSGTRTAGFAIPGFRGSRGRRQCPACAPPTFYHRANSRRYGKSPSNDF